MELKDKIVVITGGSKGLGKAMASCFLKNGAKVEVCSRDESEFLNLENGILGIKADVTKENELQSLAEKVVAQFGKIDIWINNAGIWLPRTIAEDFDMEKVRIMFDVNVFGTINGARVALRFIKKQGFGSIINIISDSAFVARPMSSMYAASKWAVNGFTKSIREANKNIKIISVYPGGMKTEIFGDKKPENYDSFMEPEFVANKIVENLKKETPEEELIIRR